MKARHVRRARRVLAGQPWRARTGEYGVAEVEGGQTHVVVCDLSSVVLEGSDAEPEATCPLATPHWSTGPPPIGPLALWVAGDPTGRAVVSLSGGADVPLATDTRRAFPTRFSERLLDTSP